MPLETTFAKHLGVLLLLANVTQQVYQMARAAGLNKEDGSSITKVIERAGSCEGQLLGLAVENGHDGMTKAL
jgi:hypothetical protein